MKKISSTLLVLSLLLLCNLLAQAQAQAQVQIVTLPTELTHIKLGELKISVLHSLVDVNNAHTVRYINFFVANPKGAASALGFEMSNNIVPHLALHGGADCRTNGIRILQRPDKLQVVFAERKGEWFDNKPFDFILYELTKNEEGAPGWPNLYFKQIKKMSTKAKYCDANRALEKEPQLFM